MLPTAPAVILTEVCFDPAGQDGSKIGAEWVELSTTQHIHSALFRLTDQQGSELATLALTNVASGSCLVVYLGSSVACPVDGDLADRSAAYAAGLPPGDYLPNASGGVRLLDGQGAIVDALYWGTGSAPPGASGASWTAGEFFDLSMAGKPMDEGDSLGRPSDPFRSYTGTLADWDRHGGRNAARPTPGGRNAPTITGIPGLLYWTQLGVNRVITGYSEMVAPGWLSILDSAVEVLGESETAAGAIVVAEHSFLVRVNGQPMTLRGTMVSRLTRIDDPRSVEFTLEMSGALDSRGGPGFSFLHSERHRGFHTNAVGVDWSTSVVYLESGLSFPFGVFGSTNWSRTALDEWTLTDSRTALDYGGAGPKVSFGSTRVHRISDGSYSTTAEVTRDAPIGPPPPGHTDSILGTEQLFIDGSAAWNDAGELTAGSYTRFDKLVNGKPRAVLAPGALGSTSILRVSGVPGGIEGSFAFALELPLEVFGNPRLIDASGLCRTHIAEGKLVSTATYDVRVDGSTWLAGSISADPPLPQGAPSSSPGGVTIGGPIIVSGSGNTVIISGGPVTIHHPAPEPAPSEPPPLPPTEPPPTIESAPGSSGGFIGAVANCAGVGGFLGLLTPLPIIDEALGIVAGGIGCGVAYGLGWLD